MNRKSETFLSFQKFYHSYREETHKVKDRKLLFQFEEYLDQFKCSTKWRWILFESICRMCMKHKGQSSNIKKCVKNVSDVNKEESSKWVIENAILDKMENSKILRKEYWNLLE